MRILVTGASGFLGSHVVEKCITTENQVYALVRAKSDTSFLNTLPSLQLRQGDLTDPDALTQATQGIDAVIHCASRVVEFGSSQQFYLENVLGTENLLRSARKSGVRKFVYVSSPSIFMNMQDQLNVNETCPYPEKFVNLYSATKAAAERLVLGQNSSEIATCSLRPRAIWGPRDYNGFMPKILSKMATGSLRDLSGDRKVLASLCYCETAAHACVMATRSPAVHGKAYFLADPEPVDIWAFARQLADLFGIPGIRGKLDPQRMMTVAQAVHSFWEFTHLSSCFPSPVSPYQIGLLSLHSTFDCSLAKRDFGFEPQVSFQSGLARLKEWVHSIGGIEKWLS